MKILLFLSILFANALQAQIQFYVSPAGANGNSGSLAQPWQTIQYALDHAVPGCTIYLLGGTYNEQAYVSISGTVSNPIRLTNYNNQNPILDGSTATGGPLLHISGISHFSVDGLEIANYSMNDAQGILIDGNCSDIQVSNNRFHHINFSSNASDIPNASTNAQPLIVYGDALSPISDLSISENEINNCRTGFSEALAVNGNVDGFSIIGNLVHDNSNIGIDVIGHEGTCSNAILDQSRNGQISWNKVWNNTSTYATSAGIYIDGAANCIIDNNIVYGNGSGIEIGCETIGASASNNQMRNNLIYKNQEAGIVVGGYDYPGNSGKVSATLIYGNTVYENSISNQTQGEMVVNYNETLQVKNNLICSGANDNLINDDANSSSVTFNFNLYFSSGSPAFSHNSVTATSLINWISLVGGDQSSLYADPLFVNANGNNFHVQANSPAIDQGDSTYQIIPGETDIDTMSRVQNGRIDIGADEFGTAVGIAMHHLQENNSMYSEMAGNELIIHFTKASGKNTMIHLYDASGKRIEQKILKAGESSISFDNSNLQSGIYIVEKDGCSLKIVR